MERVRKSILCSLGALVVLAALWGCNSTNIDDGDKSDSVLIVDSVTPSSVQADISGNTDPNTSFVSPPVDDTVEVDVRNMNRTQSESGVFGDIILNSIDLTCAFGTLQNAGSTTGTPTSLTIPAESSATISVTVATGAYKLAYPGLEGQTDTCSITFNGEDLGGHPIISKRAVFGISYVATP